MNRATAPGESDEAESDAEAAESEWHVWLLVMLVVLGVGLLVAPPSVAPELVVGIGPLLIALGITGWFVQWVYKRMR